MYHTYFPDVYTHIHTTTVITPLHFIISLLKLLYLCMKQSPIFVQVKAKSSYWFLKMEFAAFKVFV